MKIIETLLQEVSSVAEEAQPVEVAIGAHWTLVTLSHHDTLHGGLSSTLGSGDEHHHGKGYPVRDSGRLLQRSAAQLTALAHSESLLESSIGFATINALLSVHPQPGIELNAAEIIAEHGAGKRVAIVGHFPFIERIRTLAETLWVLELRPHDSDEPAERAPELLPQADVVALTGTALLNGTFDSLLAHCRRDATIVILGGTTPLSTAFFDLGISAVSGTRIIDVAAARDTVLQGATYRQIAGKLPLTLFPPT